MTFLYKYGMKKSLKLKISSEYFHEDIIKCINDTF